MKLSNKKRLNNNDFSEIFGKHAVRAAIKNPNRKHQKLFITKDKGINLDKKDIKLIPEIIAVTKSFSIDKIKPLINEGHLHFGENKIQEAEKKWIEAKKSYKNLKLHMVGKLQTNKVKKAI